MKRSLCITVALISAFVLGACSDSGLSSSTTGVMSVRLTDAPFPFASVKSADMFVVRVDAKMDAASDADVADTTDPGSDADPSHGWVTIAEPNQSYNLLDLQNGTTVNLGQATLPTGSYRGLRLILDTDKSSITLTDGTTADIVWPSAAQTGVKINADQPVDVTANGTQVVVDFDLGSSFVLRGSTIKNNGLLFKPVIRATVSNNTGSVSGSVQFANGAAVAKATVEVLKPGTALTDTDTANVLATTQTDDAGKFQFGFLTAGDYELRVTSPDGATSVLVSSITVTSGADAAAGVIVLQ